MALERDVPCCPILVGDFVGIQAQKLEFHYVGMLAECGREFDSSHVRGRPFKCTIGVRKVLRVWIVCECTASHKTVDAFAAPWPFTLSTVCDRPACSLLKGWTRES